MASGSLPSFTVLTEEDDVPGSKFEREPEKYTVVKNLAPFYLSELLPKLSSERTYYRLRSGENFTQFSCRTSRFQKSFFPSAITGWNSLDLDVRNTVSLPTFKVKVNSLSPLL